MLHLILSQIPTNLFSETIRELLQAVTSRAPMVVHRLAQLTALSSMTELQQQKLTCTYCWWDQQPQHTVECCLHKLGCCVCGQAHKGHDCNHLPVDIKVV